MIQVLIFVWAVLYVSGDGNIEKDSCGLLEKYEDFKVSMDTYFASNDICDSTDIHSDCDSIKEEFPDATDGVYRVKPADGKPAFPVYCDMSSKEGGWVVIQRRQDGSEDFFRTWFEYMDGFGNLTGEFWLGNEKIHRLTSQRNYKLRVDLKTKSSSGFAEYSHFRVASMSEFYNLTVKGYTGNASDSLTRQNHNRFTTKNLDLDKHGSKNCATFYRGAWWYKDCMDSNLNGVYTAKSYSGVWWRNFGNSKKTTMKILPVH